MIPSAVPSSSDPSEPRPAESATGLPIDPAAPHHHHHPLSERADLPISIAVDGVTKRFESRGGRATVALDNVTFGIRVGEFVSLIGPSGCGKSTLLRLVSGLVPPTSGTIRVNGLGPLEARRKRQFGVVFQSPVLFDWRTVDENIGLALQVFHRPKDEITRRVKELTDMVGLADFRDHYPWQLSGGMQQRVSIARALSFAPPFLLMDEPFGALDLITRDRMANELLQIWAATPGTTVMFITHSIPEAILLSDRVVVMSAHPGRIVTTVDIDLPRPRTEAVRESASFYRYENELRRMLLEADGAHA